METETEKLNREVKEAIASPHAALPLRCNVPLCNSVAKQVACACGISASLPQGTAKITEIDLKQIDFTKYEPSKIDFDLRKIGLSQMVLMARSDYMGPAPAPEISRANQENLKHGYYVLSEEEKKILQGNSGNLEFIWDKIGSHSVNSIAEGRQYAGFEQTGWDSVREHKRIFIPSTLALNNIKVEIGDHKISDMAKYRLRVVIIFAKFLGANIEKAFISSTLRSAEKQADIMISDYFSNPYNTFYPNSRVLYFQELNHNILRPMGVREQAAKEKLVEYIKKNFTSFPHVKENAGNNEVFDVAPNGSKITGRNADLLSLSVEMFKANGFISSKSLPYTLSGDKAFHFVIAR